MFSFRFPPYFPLLLLFLLFSLLQFLLSSNPFCIIPSSALHTFPLLPPSLSLLPHIISFILLPLPLSLLSFPRPFNYSQGSSIINEYVNNRVVILIPTIKWNRKYFKSTNNDLRKHWPCVQQQQAFTNVILQSFHVFQICYVSSIVFTAIAIKKKGSDMVSKAFDTVLHKRLQHRLKLPIIGGNLCLTRGIGKYRVVWSGLPQPRVVSARKGILPMCYSSHTSGV